MNRKIKTCLLLAFAFCAWVPAGCASEDSSEGIPTDLPEQRTTADPNLPPSRNNAAETQPMEVL
jgi:hypothetical protein